jgi:hypothetical protein
MPPMTTDDHHAAGISGRMTTMAVAKMSDFA